MRPLESLLSLCLCLGAWICGAAGGRGGGGGGGAGGGGGGGAGGASPPDPDSPIPRARCVSRCLSLQMAVPAAMDSFQCLQPCKEAQELTADQCQTYCEAQFPASSSECLTSCSFLAGVRQEKQGACPAPARARGFAAACVESCAEDWECAGARRCCPNGCGRTCQAPRAPFRGVPLKPRKELRFLELASGQLQVRWSSRFNVSLEPVVYVVQQRWNHGLHPSEDEATPWETVTQTTEQGAQVQDVRSSRWYQFRVAAVNVHGTRGFTAPSRHFRSSREPSAPPAPRGLHLVGLRPDGDGVTADLAWDPEPPPDLPIHHYRLRWGPADTQEASRGRRRTTADGLQHRVELSGLQSGLEYLVELQAVTYWGPRRLKSPKALLHFQAMVPELPEQVGKLRQSHPPVQPQPERRSRPSIRRGLEVGNPFYQDGRLQVKVYWKNLEGSGLYHVQWTPQLCAHQTEGSGPESTTTQDNHLILPDLSFSCKYKVTLKAAGSPGHPNTEEAVVFTTPPCWNGQQGKRPGEASCPGEEGPSLPHILPKPENLSASFTFQDGSLTGFFSWKMAAGPPPVHHEPPSGFEVTWTRVTPESRQNNLPNSVASQSEILPPDRLLLRVPGLKPASLYRLEVQALTPGGRGPKALATFKTPDPPPAPSPHRLQVRPPPPAPPQRPSPGAH